MRVEELREGTERAWRRAYGWREMARRLKRTAAPLHVAVTTNLAYRHYARNLRRFYTCDALVEPALPAVATALAPRRPAFPDSTTRTGTGSR
jgi:hypothetical protein